MTPNPAKGLFDLRYEILLFISYNRNAHLWLSLLLKFEFARARTRTFYIEVISFQCRQILVKINNSNF